MPPHGALVVVAVRVAAAAAPAVALLALASAAAACESLVAAVYLGHALTAAKFRDSAYNVRS